MDKKIHSLIFEGSPMPSAILDMDAPAFSLLEANRSFVEFTQYQKEHITPEGIFDAYRNAPTQPYSQRELSTSLRGVLETQAPQTMAPFSDGGNKIRYAVNAPILDESGQIQYILHTIQEAPETIVNDTKPKGFEDMELKFKSIFEHNAVGIALVGLDGTWLEVNDRTCEITGYHRQELFRKTFHDITHPEDLDKDIEMVDRVLKGKITHYKLEKRYYRKDGHTVWVYLSVSLIRNKEGVPLHFVSTIMDITDKKAIEASLRTSEQKYESLFIQHPDAVFSLDLEGNFIQVNPASAKLIEGPIEEVLNTSFIPLLPKHEQERVYQKFLQSRSGALLHFNTSFTSRKGTQRILSITSMPIHADGEIVGVYGVARDVSAIIQAEAAIKKSRDRFIKLISTLDGVVWESEAEDFRLTYISPQSKDLIGFEPEEFYEEPRLWLSLIYPEDYRTTLDACIQAIDAGKNLTLEFRMVDADGNIIWVRDIISVIKEKNKPTYLRGIIYDITKEKEIENQLRQSEEKFKKLIQDGSDMITVLDEQFNYTYVSPSSYAILGTHPEEYLNHNAFDFIHPEDKPEIEKYAISLPTAKRIHLPPFRFKDNQGNWRWLETVITNLLEDTTIQGLVGNSRDITDRIESEAKLQQSEEKYRTMFDFSPLPQFIYDLKTLRFLDVNQTSISFYGYSKEEMLKMTLGDIRPAQEVEKMEQANLENLFQPGVHKFGVFTHKKKNGDLAEMEIYGYRFGYEGHDSKMVIALDVTEREEALKNLHDNELKLITAQKIAKLGYWKFDLEENTLFWSSELYQIYEIALDTELSPDSLVNKIHPDDLEKYNLELDLALDGTKALDLEYRILLTNDKLKWVHQLGQMVSNEEGLPKHLEGTIQDITDKRLDKERLIISENRSRGIIESQTNYIVRTDLEGNYTFVNPKFQQDFGWLYPDQGMLGQHSLSSILSHHHERVQKVVEDCYLNLNKIFKVELDKPGPNGETKATLWDFVCLTDNMGNPSELQCVGIDITERKKAENDLLESNQRYELVTEATNDAVWDLDFDKQEIFRGKGFEKLFGYPSVRGNYSPDFWGEKIHPQDRGLIKDSLDNFLQGDDLSWQLTYRVKRADGSYAFVKDQAVVIRDEAGRPIRMVGAVQDQTFQWFSEKEDQLKINLSKIFTGHDSLKDALTRSLEEMLRFCELNYSEIWVTSMDRKNLDLFAYAGIHETLPTKEVHSLKAFEGLPGLVWEKEQILILEDLQNHPDFVRKNFAKTNRLKAAIGYPVKFNQQVVAVLVQYSAHPNTNLHVLPKLSANTLDQLAGEFQRKKLEHELNLFFDLSPDLLCIVGLDGYFKKINAAFGKLLGYSNKRLLETSFVEFIHPEDKSDTLNVIKELTTGSIKSFENRFLTKDGQEIWLSWTATPLPDEGLVFAIARDMSARIKAEQQLKELNKSLQKQAKELSISNAELEQFAYVASHDLQEPLRMVTSFLKQLERKYEPVLDEKGKKYIYFAVDGAMRMRQIILDLLEFSRVGRINTEAEEVDLNALLQEVQLLLRQQIEDSSAVVKVEDLPTIRTFKTPIRQVFQNLLGNALKYQNPENDRPLIRVSCQSLENYWRVSLQDNGIGINPEYFDKIFIIFQRLHSKEEFSGTGMGLAVTKKIIENLGGQIWVESRPGEGSTFHFTIPKN